MSHRPTVAVGILVRDSLSVDRSLDESPESRERAAVVSALLRQWANSLTELLNG